MIVSVLLEIIAGIIYACPEIAYHYQNVLGDQGCNIPLLGKKEETHYFIVGLWLISFGCRSVCFNLKLYWIFLNGILIIYQDYLCVAHIKRNRIWLLNHDWHLHFLDLFVKFHISCHQCTCVHTRKCTHTSQLSHKGSVGCP